jgi:Family of unknown function (DUF6282)
VLSSTTPSEWTRRLILGAYDLHVHVAPDVMRRRITDLQLARRCRDVGLGGFVLKSHYVPTAERAAVLNEILAGGTGAGGTGAGGTGRSRPPGKCSGWPRITSSWWPPGT